jgi:hypothetical protein
MVLFVLLSGTDHELFLPGIKAEIVSWLYAYTHVSRHSSIVDTYQQIQKSSVTSFKFQLYLFHVRGVQVLGALGDSVRYR